MSGDRVTIPHVRALDGLRGVAVAGVVLYHGDHLLGGYLGVDLFFVLSGFLITSLLLAEWKGTGRVALGAFWARRARRLLPALALVLLGVALYCVVFADPTELGRIRGDALATIAYVANWRAIFAGQSYFDLFKSPSPLQHTWSLAIEEQFYVIWPLLFIGIAHFAKRRTAQAVLATAIGLGAISALAMVLLHDPADLNRVYYGTDTRAYALFAGIAVAAAVAIWGHAKHPVLRTVIEAGAILSVLVLAVMWTRLDAQSERLYVGGFAVAGAAAALVCAAVSNPRRGPVGWALSFPPLCWLGLISYGLYLWHWPVDVVFNADRVGLTGWPLFLVQTVVAVAIATASYYLVELPIRRGAISSRKWRLAIPAVAVAVGASMLMATAGATDLPLQPDDTGRAAPGGVLVVGDSVARTVAPGLDRLGFDTTNDGVNGCRLVRGQVRALVETLNCGQFPLWRHEIPALRPNVVVLVQGAFELSDVRPPGSKTWLRPGTYYWANYYLKTLEQSVRILGRGHAHVVIPLIPCFGLVGNATQFGKTDAFDVDRVVAANRVISLLASRNPHVSAPNTFGFLCPHGDYQSGLQGVDPVRFDGVHYTKAGSDLIARFLAPTIRPWLTGQGPAAGSPAGSTAPTTASTVARPPGS